MESDTSAAAASKQSGGFLRYFRRHNGEYELDGIEGYLSTLQERAQTIIIIFVCFFNRKSVE